MDIEKEIRNRLKIVNESYLEKYMDIVSTNG